MSKPGSGSTVGASVVPQVLSMFDTVGWGLDTTHSYLMVKGVLERIDETIAAGSPWDNAVAINPEPLIRDLSERLQDYLDSVNAYNDTLRHGLLSPTLPHLDNAVEAVETIIGGSINETTAVTAFEATTLPEYNNALNAICGGLYAANASEGSALFIALANLRRGRLANIASFRTRFKLDAEDRKAAIVLQAVEMIDRQLQAAVAQRQAAFIAEAQADTWIQTVRREEQDDNIEYAYKYATWPLSNYAFAQSSIASIGGAPTIPLGPSKISSMLSSAFSMAATGASVGAAGGVTGAAIGGVLGGLMGLVGGAIDIANP